MDKNDAFIGATSLRARAYAYILEEMEKVCNKKTVEEAFSSATYRLGEDKAVIWNKKVVKNPVEFADQFVADEVGNRVFAQKIRESDSNHAVIEMKSCPLVEEWKRMGLDDRRIEKLCDVACQIDYGTVERCGLKLRFLERMSYGDEACVLLVEKK